MSIVRLLMSCLCLSSLTLNSQQLSAQGFLEQMGRRLGSQINQEAQRQRSGIFNPPAANDQSGAPQSFSIPGESGRENTPGGSFSGGGFFEPRLTPPRMIQPQPQPSVPPVYRDPRSDAQQSPQRSPRQTYPQQTQPVPSYQPAPSYQAPPAAPPRLSTSVSNLEFKIRCPKSLGRSISYQLVSPSSVYPFTMQPGQAQTLVESKVWLIRYANNAGQVSYRLRGGKQYEFAIDARGQIQLYEADDEISEPPRRSNSRIQGGI